MKPLTSLRFAAIVLALVCVGPVVAELEVTALLITPRLDLRARAGNPTDETFRIQQLEASATLSVSDGRKELVTFALQGNLETPMTGRARQMHFSNAWALVNLGIGRPKVKLGQFVAPFGTLAEFDVHGVPLQTPYARALGIRLDRGVAFEGSTPGYDYWLSFTGGDGRGRFRGGHAVIARVAWDRDIGDDFLRTGVSVVEGRNMPVFPTNPMPVPMGMDAMVTHVDKWRVAGDFDWLHDIDNIRAELVFGGDDGQWVNGQWLYYNHPFSYKRDLSLQTDRWKQGDGTSWGVGAQYHQRLDDFSGLRVAYEKRWAERTFAPDATSDMFTLQYYRDWAWTPNL